MGLIYLAKHKENGHMYIGKTSRGLEVRKQGHLYDATVRKRNTAFCNAIRKYGIDKFEWSILEDDIPKEDLDAREKHYIAKYSTYLGKQHYNMTEGGEGFSPDEEIRNKISEAHTGKKLSEEHRKRLSESHTENVTMVAEGEEVVLVFSNRKEAYKYCVEQGLANCTYQTFTVSIRNSIKRNQKRYGFKWRIEK